MQTQIYTPEKIFPNCKNVVFTVTKDNHQKVVYKVIPVLQNDLNKKILSEGICYANLQYRFLMHLYSWKIYPTAQLPFPSTILPNIQQGVRISFTNVQVLEFEYYKGGNLIEFVRKHPLDMEQKKIIFVNILLGLAFIHSNHYVHSDIKPPNILVNLTSDENVPVAKLQFDAVITDFGSMQRLPPGKKSTPFVEYTKFDISVTFVRVSFL